MNQLDPLRLVCCALFKAVYSMNKFGKVASRFNKPEQIPSNLAYEKTRTARRGSARNHGGFSSWDRHPYWQSVPATAAGRNQPSRTRHCGACAAALSATGCGGSAALHPAAGVSVRLPMRPPLSAPPRPRSRTSPMGSLPRRPSWSPLIKPDWLQRIVDITSKEPGANPGSS